MTIYINVRWCKIHKTTAKKWKPLAAANSSDRVGDLQPSEQQTWVPQDKIPQHIREKLVEGRASAEILMDVCASKRLVSVPGRVHPETQRSTMGLFLSPVAATTTIKKWSNVKPEDKDGGDEDDASSSDSDKPPRKTARGPWFVLFRPPPWPSPCLKLIVVPQYTKGGPK